MAGMQIINGIQRFRAEPGGCVLCIGNFDGVHCGHAAILAQAHAVGQRLGVPVVVLTFHPHPLRILAPGRSPAQLVTLAEKLALLQQHAVSACIVEITSPELLALSPADFLTLIISHCHPCAFVEGPDFRFGHGRAGTIATLQSQAQQGGYEVQVVEPVRGAELPEQPIISSTAIRRALLDGRIADARAMLGRPYRIAGTVGDGAGRGATLGFPTANLTAIPHLLPACGVYAAVAQLSSGALHLAAVNVGLQPTFDGRESRVEAYLLDFVGDLRGRRVALHLIRRLRAQTEFKATADLVAQIEVDVAAVRAEEATRADLREQRLVSP